MDMRMQSRPVAAALLQLLGWVGFLGVGYLIQRRFGVGFAMMVGWWLTYWVLLAAGVVTFGLFHIVMICVWLAVPPITAVFLYFEQ